MAAMKVRGAVQRLFRPTIEGLPVMQHLRAGADGWEWADDNRERHAFPEYDSYGTCQAGAKCEIHAECVAKAMGGFPVVLNRDAAALLKAPTVSVPVRPVQAAVERSRPRVISEADAISRWEKDHEV